MSAPENPSLRQLLLHRLGEDEARALEERLMLEDGLAEELREAQHDLLDDYARGRLSPADRATVEKYLLARTEDRQRLKIAAALARMRPGPRLMQVATAARPPRRWPMRLALATAASAVLATLLFLPGIQSGFQSTVTADVVLLADSERGASTRGVDVGSDVTRLRLQLEIPGAAVARAYRVSIAERDGPELYESSTLEPRRAGGYEFVEVLVPTTLFASGARKIRLVPAGIAATAPTGTAFTWQIELHRH